jgi:lipoprotein-anchoring transpeptidase ErfK/SrfK
MRTRAGARVVVAALAAVALPGVGAAAPRVNPDRIAKTEPGAYGVAPAERARDGVPGDTVRFSASFAAGSIVIVNSERRLYYVLGGGRAIRYPIAIGSAQNLWTGQSFIQSKQKNPAWIPPWNPSRVVPGGPGNPLGERALYLGWTTYRIHGTNAPGSIGHSVSNGCFRMHNRHVRDLYERVHLGAPVYVVQALTETVENRGVHKRIVH